MWRFFTQTLHGRLLLLTSGPLILLAVLLTASTLSDERFDVQREYQDAGIAVASYLATTSDFALYSGNEQLLNTLATSMSELVQIDAVIFLNIKREVLVSSFAGQAPWSVLLPASIGSQPLSAGGRLYIERPVVISGVEIEDYVDLPSPQGESAAVTGWVIVVVDMSAVEAERQAVLLRNGGTAVGLLALVSVLSYILGSGMLAPITSLKATVEAIEGGDLEAQVEAMGVDELAALGRGVNYMARSIAGSQRSLEQRVSSATSRLRMSLQDLQAKNLELEEERQKAEEANRAKSDFLARMSHELRTPLNAIQGFVRLLEQSRLDASEQQYCAIIEQAAEQLLLLINDILEHARLQSDAMGFDIQPLEIVACIENPVRLLGPSAYEKNVEVIIDVDPELPVFLLGDSLRLRQVVSNLLANAIKFTERGHILVRLSNGGVVDDRVTLVLEVEDTGIGMSTAQQEKIFEAFTQADTSITRRFGGTGLGLSIVQTLVALMDGEITLHSEESVGTTVRVSLPLALQEGHPQLNPLDTTIAVFDPLPVSCQALGRAVQRMTNDLRLYSDFEVLIKDLVMRDIEAIVISLPIAGFEYSLADMLVRLREFTPVPIFVFLPLKGLRGKARFNIGGVEGLDITYLTKPWATTEFYTTYNTLKHGSPIGSGRLAPLQDVKVLVAEDNDFSRLLLSTLLEKAGCEMQSVENGREALARCEQERFDLLVFDVHMPELNGIDALVAIRASGGQNTATPAVVLTADVLQHEDRLASLPGRNKMMHKPFDNTRLIDLMLALLDRQPSQAPLPAVATRHIPLGQFFQEVDKLLASAVLAYQERDIEALRETIHQLLGIAGVFKQGELEKQVQALHTLVKEEDAWVGDALQAVEEELARLKAEAGEESA
ncbi:MAG: response regulator [Gammaproteobacteria bacterium]|nr:response regulator [Gammaproteobacteria bacterium]MBQ0840926.1 response regulator [Gammaproteobacteria bacterium]